MPLMVLRSIVMLTRGDRLRVVHGCGRVEPSIVGMVATAGTARNGGYTVHLMVGLCNVEMKMLSNVYGIIVISKDKMLEWVKLTIIITESDDDFTHHMHAFLMLQGI